MSYHFLKVKYHFKNGYWWCTSLKILLEVTCDLGIQEKFENYIGSLKKNKCYRLVLTSGTELWSKVEVLKKLKEGEEMCVSNTDVAVEQRIITLWYLHVVWLFFLIVCGFDLIFWH